MLFKIDRILVAWFETFSHRTQLWMGINCFKWARISFSIAIWIMVTLFIDLNFFHILMKPKKVLFVPYFSIPTLAMLISGLLRGVIEEKRIFKTNILTKNELEIKLYPVRIIFVIFGILLTIIIKIGPGMILFDPISSIFIYAGLYFSSCTPLPWQKSKAREWVESMLKKRIAVKHNANT